MTEHVEFTDEILLYVHPQHLGKSIVKHVQSQLESQLEKKWSEKHGFVHSVEMLPLRSAGRINAKTGFTEITVQYKAKSCKPVEGEILEAKINLITKLGVHFTSGPFKLFIHEKMLPASYVFIGDTYRCSISNRNLEKNQICSVKIVGTKWTDGEYLLIVSLYDK